MYTSLVNLRARLLAAATLSYLADVEIVPTFDPLAWPLDLAFPSVYLKDGQRTRFPQMSGTGTPPAHEDVTIEGLAIVQIMTGLGHEGRIVGDTARGIKGLEQIMDDLIGVIDGDVTSLDGVGDIWVQTTRPSEAFAGSEGDSYISMKPFTLALLRHT